MAFHFEERRNNGRQGPRVVLELARRLLLLLLRYADPRIPLKSYNQWCSLFKALGMDV
jgi:hypothetical protein